MQLRSFALAAALTSGMLMSSAASAVTISYDVNNAALFTSTSVATSPVEYGFDYSTHGIPQAPGTSGTTAMRLRANIGPTGVGGGVTVTPVGAGFTGDYKITASVWMNTFGSFNGVASNGTGTSQFFGLGGSYNGTGSGVNYRAGNALGGGSGVWFAGANEGGFTGSSLTIRDFNAFTGSGAVPANFKKAETDTGVYAAGNSATAAGGSQDAANAFYTTAFPLIDVTTVNGGTLASMQNALVGATPQSLAASNNGQGAGVAGGLAFKWREWEVERVGSTVTWKIDGTLIATVTDNALANGSPSLTYFDANAGVSQYPELNEALVANLTVTGTLVPEPVSLAALVGLGGFAIARRRKA